MSKRKRRPRASGSGKKVNPLKIVLITGGILLLTLVVGLLVLKSNLESWLKGDGLRDFLTEKSALVLKSEVTFGVMKWDGSQVYADTFSARGYEDAAIAKLDINSIRASYGGAKQGAVMIPEIKINRMNLEFSPHKKKGDFLPPVESGSEEGESSLPLWITSRLPNRVEIDSIEIAACNLETKDAAGQEILSLKGVRTRVLPDFEAKSWEIKGDGGKFFLLNQPEMKIKNLACRWQNGNLFLNKFALGIFGNGHIDGLGEVSFENSPPKLDLELTFSRIDVHDVIKDEEWKNRLSGTLRGPVRLLGAAAELRQEGTIHLEEGLLKSLPILETIATYTRSDKFKRLALNEAHSDFVRKGDKLELRNLVVQSDGLLRVEGRIDLVGEQLRGDLKIGVVPGTLRWIPGAEKSVFTSAKNGFLWTNMKLSGTTGKPVEDLSGRLIQAAGEAIFTGLPKETLNQAKKLLGGDKKTDGTTEKAGDVIDQGKKILNLLSPILLGK